MSKAYHEYSKLRGIAQSRLQRLQMMGAPVEGISFPTVAELQKNSISAARAEKNVMQFLAGPTTVKEWRKTPADLFPSFRATAAGVEVAPKAVLQHRERNRRYRERQREIYSKLTKDQQALLKAAKRLGVTIAPGQAEAFEEYIKYRYAQGIGSVKYFMGNVVEDFENYRKNNPRHNAKEILDDFNRFAADRSGLQKLFDKITSGKEPTTRQSDIFNQAWERFSEKWKR